MTTKNKQFAPSMPQSMTVDRSFYAPRRLTATAVCLAFLAQSMPIAAVAGVLTVDDGVVIKFGPQAQLVVRDQIAAGKGIVLTSTRDDSVGGQTGTSPQTAAAGEWRGMRIEKSASVQTTLNDMLFSYAGAADGADTTAALTLRGQSSGMSFLQFNDNLIGLRLLDGANPVLSGASFLRNGTGLEVDGNSSPTISASQFGMHTTLAINNKTPATVVQATNNWWAHSSGPKEAIANPQGQGEPVSTGVNFSGFMASAPLINPTVRLKVPAAYVDQPTVQLELACVNAVAYRIAESPSFAGTEFQPLPGGRATVPYIVSAGDGIKQINVQYRSAGGSTSDATIAGGILLDTAVPTVAITFPQTGSVIGQSITLQATASDAGGVAQVQFMVDDTPIATRTIAPYSALWDIGGASNGVHTIKAVATDKAGRASTAISSVTVARVPVEADTAGPEISGVNVNGIALAEGALFARTATITLSASDRSGIARVELKLDGQTVGVASGSGTFAVPFNLNGVANGAHTLTLVAMDSVGNTSNSSFNVVVNHAAPDAPLLVQAANGTTTRSAELAISGTAVAGSSVQLSVNGQAAGAAVTANANGQFSGTVILRAGLNSVSATAQDQYGTSPASVTLTVTLDTTVPAAPGALSALAMAGGKVRLTWARSTDPNVAAYHVYRAAGNFESISQAVKANASALTVTSYDDMPPSDGAWTYRVVAVNAAGTPSVPGNAVQLTSDSTAPKITSITYASLGKSDPITGRLGQGRVNVVLTLSEPLQTPPYLSIVPQGGAPIPVELTKDGITGYTGYFHIDATTPSGTANALFSARDAVGNRGTDIDGASSLQIETAGPGMSGITLSPVAPIKNVGTPLIQATFIFTKAPAAVPQVKYLLSGPVRTPVALATLTQVNATTYTGSFTLPADAGMGNPETFSFSYQAKDALDNYASKITAPNRFQVYQGNLPPLNVPIGFTAVAQPGGKVRLRWLAVDDAASYQIYRQGPSQQALQALARTSGIEYIDQTPQDGAYKYAVATVRQSNGQEALSGQTVAIDVTTSANAPGAPQGLALQVTGQGLQATWQPPLASTVDSYNLYRAAGQSISSIASLTPYKTKIKNPIAYDSNPSPSESAYVVTAVDAAGNESAMSNSAYLNASLLPVRLLKIEQVGSGLPVLSWTAPNGNVSGYLVYIGPDAGKIKLTANPTSSTSLTDTGYTAGERRYTVASVDSNGVELPRSMVLPNVSTQIVAGLPIKRGMMNKLQVQVANTSATSLPEVRVVVRLPIDKDGTQFKDHKSEPFALGANSTRLASVIVGGYTDMAANPLAQVGVEIVPDEDGLVKIARAQAVDVSDGALVVGMTTEAFTRGGTGKVKLNIENTGEVDVELLTATNNGASDSSELRFKLIDGDGNVLATQPYKQVMGANVVTLTNGQTVARIAAGANYVSDVFELNVPLTSPNGIRVRLDVDKLRYHSGEPDEVQIAGRGSERGVSLLETAYYGEVMSVSPISSFGDQDVLITGRALDRAGNVPMPNTRLKLVLNQQGFERTFQVLTDGSGNFAYNFKPTLTDAGLYKVSAVHPSITDRPEQKAFTINRVTVGPAPYRLDVPKNLDVTIPFMAKAGAGTSATQLRLTLDAASQPTGQIPVGITAQLPAPVDLAERQTMNVPVIFKAGNDAQPSGTLIFNVVSAEHANTPIGQVAVNYTLSEAKPYLNIAPAYVETGLAQGSAQVETVTVKNSGLQDAENLRFTLTKPDGSAAPSWASVASQSGGPLPIGATRSVDLSFMPPASLQAGVYEFKLNIVGDNLPEQLVNVYVNLSQSGQGSLLFKAADIYTATMGKDGKLIAGLANAKVTVTNEDVPSITQELTTDIAGEALFQNLQAGSYKFRAKAANHQETAGRLLVKPGITATQPIFLDYNLVTVEWSVREIALQDRYEITLNTTFETDVPGAVLVMQPAGITLPDMKPGDVYYGEISLANYGLVRADRVKQTLPPSDPYFRYEFLADVPSTLAAKQRVTIPFRVVALQPLDGDGLASASGGGCSGYSSNFQVTCEYNCPVGYVATANAQTSFIAPLSVNCPRRFPGYGRWMMSNAAGGSGGGGSLSPTKPSQTIPKKGQKCAKIPEGGKAAPKSCD